VLVVNTEEGVRALSGDDPIKPESVERYLKGKFGQDLESARQAMADLAEVYHADELDDQAYDLYEKFRPEVPRGVKGWGVAGELDLEFIRSLVEEG
jgi:hypothetical protein